jgi:D-xylose transport system permease protein
MMGATSPSAALPEPQRGESIKQLLGGRTLRMVFVLLALWLVLGVHPETRGAFLSAQNFSNLTAQIAEIVIIGAGMTMVILIRGIDLSVGAGMALTGVIAAKLQIDHGQPAWIAILAAILVSTVIGLLHGVLVSRFQVPAFIATLAGFLAYRGIGLVVSESRGLSPMKDDFAVLGSRLGPGASMAIVVAGCAIGLALIAHVERRRKVLGLSPRGMIGVGLRGLAVLAAAAFFAVIYKNGMPVPALIAGVTTALCALVLGWTRTGRYAFAIGGNAEAARLSGVPVARVTLVIYLVTGVLTAVAGMVMAARTNGVTPGNAGLMKELHVITAVVIGGTSLTGGRATIAGTVIGAFVFGTLSNGMNLMNVNSNWQLILTGAILLFASLLDSMTHRKRHA